MNNKMAITNDPLCTTDESRKPTRAPYGSIVKRYHSLESRQELSKRVIEHLKSGKPLGDFQEINKRSLQQLMTLHKEDFDIETIKKFMSLESAVIGKSSSLKYKTSEERKELFKKFCEHVAKGYNRHAFPDVSFETVRKYMKDYPEDMDQELLGEAERAGFLKHEQIGFGLMTGQIRGSAAAWKFTMVNKFKYIPDENNTIVNNNNTQNNNLNTSVQIYLPDNKREISNKIIDSEK
jgi:hypothetical protein